MHAVPSYVSRKTSPLDQPLTSAYRYDPPPPWPLGGPVHRGEQELCRRIPRRLLATLCKDEAFVPEDPARNRQHVLFFGHHAQAANSLHHQAVFNVEAAEIDGAIVDRQQDSLW